jgi:hypothetical protein
MPALLLAKNKEHQVESNLFEGLEAGDLKRLIHPELHIDEFKSKLGDDADVIVLSFKVKSKEPANDLVAFIEKGYNWVLDADVSSGEMDDGDYIVFVELDRNDKSHANILDLMDELMNLTDQKLSDWRVRYYKSHQETRLSDESIKKMIPSSPEAYTRAYGDSEIDDLKTAAGVKVTTKAPKNEYTEALRNLAGIIR